VPESSVRVYNTKINGLILQKDVFHEIKPYRLGSFDILLFSGFEVRVLVKTHILFYFSFLITFLFFVSNK